MTAAAFSRVRARSPLTGDDGRLSEHLPWMVHVTPDMVLCKDGSLLAAFEFEGVDIDEDSQYRLMQAYKEMQQSMDKLDERFYLWFVTDKRLKTEPEKWEELATNEVVTLLEDLRRRTYESKAVYTLKTYVFISYTGDTGVYAFMENVRRKMSEDGASFGKAVLTSLNPSSNVRSAVLHDARQLDSNIEIAQESMAAYVATHTVARFKRLTGWELDSALLRMAAPTLTNECRVEPRPSSMLDATLATADVKIGREVFAVQGTNRTLYGTMVSLSGYPGNIESMTKLMAAQAEFRLVHVLHCMSYDHARAIVDEHARYYRMTQSTLSQRVAAFLRGVEPEVDPGKADLYAECVEAMRRQTAEQLGFSLHSTSITFFGESAQAAQQACSAVLKEIGGLPNIRERIGLKAALLSTIPGQWAHNQRLMLANNEIVSHMLPMCSVFPGDRASTHLSEVYSRPMPPLATFTSRFGTEVNFDPFVKQVGHALLVMPTGGGKTTFVNYCLAHFSRYPDAQVVIFDRDYSCRIITNLVGGTHLDLKRGMRLNPMAHIRRGELEQVQAREFIIRRVEESGERLTAADRADIFDKIKAVADSEHQEASLNTVWSLLSSDIQVKLHEWVEQGPYGYFGSDVDQLSLAKWTCIEMKEIMKVDRLGRAFLDHAFSSISRMLTGKPTFIYVEEASFALSNPSFLAGIDDWLKTFRKKNAFVWLTVQSPESVTGVDSESIRATLTDNIPNILLGANPKLESHRALYKQMFGLTDDQVSMIGSLRPQRDYLRIAGNICRVLRTNFGQDTLALIRSEPKFQDLLDRLKEEGDPNWRASYIKQAQRI
ncbi:MAG: conjugal transfer protein TraC [Hydrogenophaga sp.]|nr:conjugal transfer protein TraC [Hydrogenophaga sp.]